MENIKTTGIFFLITLGIMFGISLLLLLLIAAIAWNMDGGIGVISKGIVVIYIISNVFGGFMAGKKMGHKKLFWGMLVGVLYFGILALCGICLFDSTVAGSVKLWNGGLLCIISATTGGMLAPEKR